MKARGRPDGQVPDPTSHGELETEQVRRDGDQGPAFVLANFALEAKASAGPKLPSGVAIRTTVIADRVGSIRKEGVEPPDIPDYKLVRSVGRGAFGEVWLARNRHDGQFCAVKVFSKAKLLELEGVREYRKRAAGNPYLAPIYHVGEWGDYYYYVMPLADDAKQSTAHRLPEDYEPLTLRRYLLWHGRLTPQEVVVIASSLLSGLQRLHAAGAVHCDVKPANVMRFGGVWKVGDPTLIISREKLRSMRGTFRFWPPEGTVDQTADLYALGKTMYVLLAGAQAEVPVRIEDAPLPSGVDKGAPIWRIIERACASDPAARYRSAAEMRRDLDPLVGVPAEQTGSRRQIVPLVFAGASLVLALAVLSGRGWFSGSGVRENRSTEGALDSGVVVLGQGAPAVGDAVHGDAEELQGEVTVRVWNRYDSQRSGLAIDAPGALPLREGDRIRVEAGLKRAAYLYLVWISTDGTAQPIYPWKPGDWTSFPTGERPVRSIALPASQDEGWPVTGPPGMETIVMLASHKPSPQARRLQDLLRGLSAQPWDESRPLLIRLVRDRSHVATERGVDFVASRRIDDSLLRTHRFLIERLAEDFELVRIVSFANKTGADRQER